MKERKKEGRKLQKKKKEGGKCIKLSQRIESFFEDS
jgi:hypothetical protein